MVEKVGRINQPRFSTIKVGNAVTITFLRCLPGCEVKIAKRLCELPEATIYKVFGEADFAIVREFPDQPELPPLVEESGISNLRTITAFTWENLRALEVTNIHDYPLVGFCFLKVNPDLICSSGIEGEHIYLEAIKERIRHISKETPVRAAVCGTTGWFETIILICGTTVSDILRFSSRLRRLVVTWDKEGKKHKIPCFQTTETMPAILIHQGLVSTNVELGEDVKLELRARCYSWADARVQEQLSTLLSTPESIAGTDDFIIRDIHSRTLSEYVQVLWDLRSKTKDLLYSTKTSFILKRKPGKILEEGLEVKPPTPVSVDVNNPKLRQLSKENPTLYQTLRDSYSSLNDIIVDCRKAWAVADLVPFAQELLNSYITSKLQSKKNITELNNALGQCLDMLRWGIQQRYLGTDAFSSDFAMPLKAGGAGGIHRILTSLSLIPKVVLQGLGIRWLGFVTCGWTDDYKRFTQGVLNIRSQSILEPNNWFVIFHEIGHEYGSQIGVPNDPNIRRALMNEEICTDESLQEASEVYTEIFACLFGFGGDFDQCVSQTWKYLRSLDVIKANLPQYFLRFLMVKIFMLEDSGQEYITSKVEIKRIAQQLRDFLSTDLGLIDGIDKKEIEFACSEALKLRTVLDVIRDLMPPDRISRSSQMVDFTPFQDGRILLNIDDPVHFLSSVPSFCPLPTFRQSVAIVLSIWNAAMLSEKE